MWAPSTNQAVFVARRAQNKVRHAPMPDRDSAVFHPMHHKYRAPQPADLRQVAELITNESWKPRHHAIHTNKRALQNYVYHWPVPQQASSRKPPFFCWYMKRSGKVVKSAQRIGQLHWLPLVAHRYAHRHGTVIPRSLPRSRDPPFCHANKTALRSWIWPKAPDQLDSAIDGELYLLASQFIARRQVCKNHPIGNPNVPNQQAHNRKPQQQSVSGTFQTPRQP